MIIVIPANKDNYVTNLKTKSIDCLTSNVGHAATLDLFKLYNENKNAKSWAAFKVTGNLTEGNEISLTDASNNSVTYIIDTTSNTDDSAENKLTGTQKIIIGTSDINMDSTSPNYAERIATSINNTTLKNNGLTLNITAYGNSNNELILKQNDSGESGDTTFTMPNNIKHIGGESITKFSRIDYSGLLLNFDIAGFKDKFMSNVNFDDSAFNNLKAEVVLYDVSTGQTKPRNYKLVAYNLKKDFEEGIGKDTIHFSDIGEISNFKSLNSNNTNNTWKIPGYFSLLDDFEKLDHPNDNSAVNPEFNIVKGDEDVIFDITDYFKNQVKTAVNSKGMLITFEDSNKNDQKSYFVKRFGSRHLLNKSLVPILKISIPDSSFTIPKKSQFAKRYLNSQESFYLFNRNNSLIEFESPDNASTLKFKILSEDKTITYLDNKSTSSVINFKGQTLAGVKKGQVSKDDLDRFSSSISSKIKDEKLVTYIRWYWDENDSETDHIIKDEKVIFNLMESTNDKTYSNLVSRVKFENTSMQGDNNINEGHVYFVDTRASLEIVKVPFDILSENLGSVKYQLVNIENNKIIYDYSDSTELFYDGEKYVFNFCIPEIYKKFRVKFNFKVTNQVSNNEYIIKNKEIFRIE